MQHTGLMIGLWKNKDKVSMECTWFTSILERKIIMTRAIGVLLVASFLGLSSECDFPAIFNFGDSNLTLHRLLTFFSSFFFNYLFSLSCHPVSQGYFELSSFVPSPLLPGFYFLDDIESVNFYLFPSTKRIWEIYLLMNLCSWEIGIAILEHISWCNRIKFQT